MPAKRKSFKVRQGNSHITVAPWTHSGTGSERWRFAYRPDPGADWKYKSYKTKAEAEAQAAKKLDELQAGTNRLNEVSPSRRRWLEELDRQVSEADQDRVLAFVAALHRSSEIAGAVDRFLSAKTSKAGEETPHVARLRGVLEHMAGHFHGQQVADIHLGNLQQWFDDRTTGRGWKRRKDIRAALVQFFRWAKKQGIAGNDAVTVADKLPEIGGEHGNREYLTPDQFQQLAGAIHEDFRAWLVLGCFAGLRPEEIAPPADKKANKRGLRCEEIDWQFNIIRVAPEVSKVGLPRTVPLTDACRAGLAWAGIEKGMTGPVCLTNPAKPGELARLGSLLFGGPWPRNICRHSYGSYRNAILRSLGQVAEEMGTSVSMLNKHYHNPRATEEGEAWFSIRPGVPIRSDQSNSDDQSAESLAL